MGSRRGRQRDAQEYGMQCSPLRSPTSHHRPIRWALRQCAPGPSTACVTLRRSIPSPPGVSEKAMRGWVCPMGRPERALGVNYSAWRGLRDEPRCSVPMSRATQGLKGRRRDRPGCSARLGSRSAPGRNRACLVGCWLAGRIRPGVTGPAHGMHSHVAGDAGLAGRPAPAASSSEVR